VTEVPCKTGSLPASAEIPIAQSIGTRQYGFGEVSLAKAITLFPNSKPSRDQEERQREIDSWTEERKDYWGNLDQAHVGNNEDLKDLLAKFLKEPEKNSQTGS